MKEREMPSYIRRASASSTRGRPPGRPSSPAARDFVNSPCIGSNYWRRQGYKRTDAKAWEMRRSRRSDRTERDVENNHRLLMLLVSTAPRLHRVVMTGGTARVGGSGRLLDFHSFWKSGNNEPHPQVPR